MIYTEIRSLCYDNISKTLILYYDRTIYNRRKNVAHIYRGLTEKPHRLIIFVV